MAVVVEFQLLLWRLLPLIPSFSSTVVYVNAGSVRLLGRRRKVGDGEMWGKRGGQCPACRIRRAVYCYLS